MALYVNKSTGRDKMGRVRYEGRERVKRVARAGGGYEYSTDSVVAKKGGTPLTNVVVVQPAPKVLTSTRVQANAPVTTVYTNRVAQAMREAKGEDDVAPVIRVTPDWKPSQERYAARRDAEVEALDQSQDRWRRYSENTENVLNKNPVTKVPVLGVIQRGTNKFIAQIPEGTAKIGETVVLHRWNKRARTEAVQVRLATEEEAKADKKKAREEGKKEAQFAVDRAVTAPVVVVTGKDPVRREGYSPRTREEAVAESIGVYALPAVQAGFAYRGALNKGQTAGFRAPPKPPKPQPKVRNIDSFTKRAEARVQYKQLAPKEKVPDLEIIRSGGRTRVGTLAETEAVVEPVQVRYDINTNPTRIVAVQSKFKGGSDLMAQAVERVRAEQAARYAETPRYPYETAGKAPQQTKLWWGPERDHGGATRVAILKDAVPRDAGKTLQTRIGDKVFKVKAEDYAPKPEFVKGFTKETGADARYYYDKSLTREAIIIDKPNLIDKITGRTKDSIYHETGHAVHGRIIDGEIKIQNVRNFKKELGNLQKKGMVKKSEEYGYSQEIIPKENFAETYKAYKKNPSKFEKEAPNIKEFFDKNTEKTVVVGRLGKRGELRPMFEQPELKYGQGKTVHEKWQTSRQIKEAPSIRPRPRPLEVIKKPISVPLVVPVQTQRRTEEQRINNIQEQRIVPIEEVDDDVIIIPDQEPEYYFDDPPPTKYNYVREDFDDPPPNTFDPRQPPPPRPPIGFVPYIPTTREGTSEISPKGKKKPVRWSSRKQDPWKRFTGKATYSNKKNDYMRKLYGSLYV